MHFLSQHTKIYAFVAPLRPVYRYLITLVVLALVVYSWFTWMYSPLEVSISNCAQQCSRLQQDQHLAQQIAPSSIRLEKIVQDMTRALSEKNSADHATALPMMLGMVQQAQVKLVTCNMEKEIHKEWYTQQQMTLDCSGPLKNCMHFLALISQQSVPLIIEQVVLTAATNQLFNLHLAVSFIAVP